MGDLLPRVTSSIIIFEGTGQQGHQCDMSDGSRWQCDKEMKNWKKIKETDDALTEAFRAHVQNSGGQ